MTVNINIKPDPDFNRFKQVLTLAGEPDRVPFYELFADPPIMEAIMGSPVKTISELVEYQYKLGYDYVTVHVKGLEITSKGQKAAEDTAELSKGERSFNTADMGVIRSREDYENYPWPQKEDIDLSPIDEAAQSVHKGMKVIVRLGHQLEDPMRLMGYEGLSFALIDQPELVKEVFDRIGSLYLHAYEKCAQHEAVGALEISDDLGFKTSTMISPEALRKYVFPWYKKFVEASHAHDVPVILHSCGNLEEVYDDIIDCGIDAKHSYEDQILPPEAAKKKFGDSMAVLGGIDVDFLCRAEEKEIRARTREVLEKCMPGGGYALGTGNSVANYIPLDNFLAMVDEGWKCGHY